MNEQRLHGVDEPKMHLGVLTSCGPLNTGHSLFFDSKAGLRTGFRLRTRVCRGYALGFDRHGTLRYNVALQL